MIAEQIPTPKAPAAESADELAQQEAKSFSKLPPTAKAEYYQREQRKFRESLIQDYRRRCDAYERRHQYLLVRVAELEHAAKSTKASFDLAVIGVTVGGTILSLGGYVSGDSLRWALCGLGAGMQILALLQVWLLSRRGWPDPRQDPETQNPPFNQSLDS